MNYKLWTIEEESKLRELVETGKYSFKMIGEILNRTGQSCQDHSREMGMYNVFTNRKYTYNENFWSLPNKINAYYSGFSSADASIYQSKSGYACFKIEISKRDLSFLEEFKKNCGFGGPIRLNSRLKKYKSHEILTETVSLCVCSRKWVDDLNKNFNIIPKKTKILSPPPLDGEFMWYWLCGYTCGDGTIHLSKDRKRFYINYVSASEKIINYIADLIKENFTNNCLQLCVKGERQSKNFCTTKKLKHANAYALSICGARACVLFDYLHQIQGLPRLSRKWEQPQVLEHVANLKQKHPHLFKVFPYNDELNKQIIDNKLFTHMNNSLEISPPPPIT